MGSIKKPCKVEGCSNFNGGLTGYCTAHILSIHECRVCGVKVAAWSRNKLCREHYWMAGKLKNFDENPVP